MPRKTLILMAGLASLMFASVQAWAQDLPRNDPETYYYGVDYADLTAEEKALWAKLGWDEGAWSADTPEAYPETEWSKWTGLSNLQQDALRSLGYDQKTWDRNRPRSGVEIIEAFWNSLD